MNLWISVLKRIRRAEGLEKDPISCVPALTRGAEYCGLYLNLIAARPSIGVFQRAVDVTIIGPLGRLAC